MIEKKSDPEAQAAPGRPVPASPAIRRMALEFGVRIDKADITLLEDFLQKNAPKVSRAGGKLTLTPVLTRVCAEALKKFPRFNTSLDLTHQSIIFKHYIHIGIAVDTPRGLLMPVIRNADAARFLRWICECLEQPMTMQL